MKVKKSILLWVVIAVLFIAVLWMTFQTGNVDVASQAAETTSRSASAYGSGMVGGC